MQQGHGGFGNVVRNVAMFRFKTVASINARIQTVVRIQTTGWFTKTGRAKTPERVYAAGRAGLTGKVGGNSSVIIKNGRAGYHGRAG